jgi:hypothetical protein
MQTLHGLNPSNLELRVLSICALRLRRSHSECFTCFLVAKSLFSLESLYQEQLEWTDAGVFLGKQELPGKLKNPILQCPSIYKISNKNGTLTLMQINHHCLVVTISNTLTITTDVRHSIFVKTHWYEKAGMRILF